MSWVCLNPKTQQDAHPGKTGAGDVQDTPRRSRQHHPCHRNLQNLLLKHPGYPGILFAFDLKILQIKFGDALHGVDVRRPGGGRVAFGDDGDSHGIRSAGGESARTWETGPYENLTLSLKSCSPLT